MSGVVVARSNVAGLAPPMARYSHVARARPRELLFLAGQVAEDEAGNVVGANDIAAQVRQIYLNVGKALEGAGASFANVVQFTTYIVGERNVTPFLEARGEIVDKLYPKGDFPPSTLLVVGGLVSREFLAEVTTIAAL